MSVLHRTPLGAPAAPPADEPSLALRDGLLLVAFWAAALWALDPGLIQLDYRGGWKHVPLLLLALALTFSLTCRQLEARPVRVKLDALKTTVPVLLLGAWVVVGSLFQRASSTLDNSFLNMGLTMPMAAVTIWVVLASRSPWRWIDAYIFGVGVAAFATGCVQVAQFGRIDVLHGHEYMVVPFAVYAAFRFSSRWLGWTLAACFVAFALAAKKNTAYLTVLLSLLYVAVIGVRAAWPRMDAARRGLFALGVMSTLALLASALAFILARRAEYLPTGNTNFRSYTYWRAWTKFLDSPFIGTGFVGPSSEFFPLFTVQMDTQILPTHSDLLDILANGGVVGFALWMVGMAWMLQGGLRLALTTPQQTPQRTPKQTPKRTQTPMQAPMQARPRRETALIHFVNLSALCAFLTCLFNPVLQYPNTSWTYWSLFGIAAVMPRLLGGVSVPAGSPADGARAASTERPQDKYARSFRPFTADSRPDGRAHEA